MCVCSHKPSCLAGYTLAYLQKIKILPAKNHSMADLGVCSLCVGGPLDGRNAVRKNLGKLSLAGNVLFIEYMFGKYT